MRWWAGFGCLCDLSLLCSCPWNLASECSWDLPGLAPNQEGMAKVKGMHECVDGIMSHETVAPSCWAPIPSRDGLGGRPG